MFAYVRHESIGGILGSVGVLANHDVTPDGETITLQMSGSFKGISSHKFVVSPTRFLVREEGRGRLTSTDV
jgi:hypothetical protein